MPRTLSRLDTGICGLTGERLDLDALPKSATLRKSVAGLDEDEVIAVVLEKAPGDYGFEMITVQWTTGVRWWSACAPFTRARTARSAVLAGDGVLRHPAPDGAAAHAVRPAGVR